MFSLFVLRIGDCSVFFKMKLCLTQMWTLIYFNSCAVNQNMTLGKKTLHPNLIVIEIS